MEVEFVNSLLDAVREDPTNMLMVMVLGIAGFCVYAIYRIAFVALAGKRKDD